MLRFPELLSACHSFQRVVREQHALGLRPRLSYNDSSLSSASIVANRTWHSSSLLVRRFEEVLAALERVEALPEQRRAALEVRNVADAIKVAPEVSPHDVDELLFAALTLAAPPSPQSDVLCTSDPQPHPSPALKDDCPSSGASAVGSVSGGVRPIQCLSDALVFIFLLLSLLAMVIEIYAMTGSQVLRSGGIDPFQHLIPLASLVMGTVIVALRFASDARWGQRVVERTKVVDPPVTDMQPPLCGEELRAAAPPRLGLLPHGHRGHQAGIFTAVAAHPSCSTSSSCSMATPQPPVNFLGASSTSNGRPSSVDVSSASLVPCPEPTPVATASALAPPPVRRGDHERGSTAPNGESSRLASSVLLYSTYVPLQRIGSFEVSPRSRRSASAAMSAHCEAPLTGSIEMPRAHSGTMGCAASVGGIGGGGGDRVCRHWWAADVPPLHRAHDDPIARSVCASLPLMLAHHLAVVGLDEDAQVTYWSPHMATITGFSSEEAVHTVFALMSTTPAALQCTLREKMAQLRAVDSANETRPLRLSLVSAATGTVALRGVLVRNAHEGDGPPFLILGVEEVVVESSSNVFITKYRQAEIAQLLDTARPLGCSTAMRLLAWLHERACWDHVDAIAANLGHWVPCTPTQLLTRAVHPHIPLVDVRISPDIPAAIPADRAALDTVLSAVLATLPRLDLAEQRKICTISLYVVLLRRHAPKQIVIEVSGGINASDVLRSLQQGDGGGTLGGALDACVGTFCVLSDTTCRLTFPFVELLQGPSSFPALQSASSTPSATANPSHALTVVVFDRRSLLRQHTVRALWALGHAAIAAGSIVEVVALLQRRAQSRVDCVLVASDCVKDVEARAVVDSVAKVSPTTAVLRSCFERNEIGYPKNAPACTGADHTADNRAKTAVNTSTGAPPTLPRLIEPDVLRPALAQITAAISSKEKSARAMEERRQIFTRHNAAPWRRGRLLGRGGFADVYEAHAELTGAVMAVKMIWVRDWNATMIEQLLCEVDLQSQLQHPNIVHYFYCERGTDTVNLFMELCDGSLDELLRQRWHGAMPADEAASCIAQIVDAVAFMHTRRIVHADLKPRNVLCRNGQLKVADFGGARTARDPLRSSPSTSASVTGSDPSGGGRGDRGKDTSEHADSASPRSAALCSTANPLAGPLPGATDASPAAPGTLRYMAPEVARGEPPSTATDIWCVGLITAELLGAQLPDVVFGGGLAAVHERLDACGIRGDARGFVEACLRPAPENRPTATALMTHPFLAELDSAAIQGCRGPITADQS